MKFNPGRFLNKNNSDGFTFVEILVVIGLSTVFLLGTTSLFYLSLRSSRKASLAAQAKSLTQEGMEAVVAIRDLGGVQWDWSSTPVNTNTGEYYQPYLSGWSWILGSKISLSPAPTMAAPNTAFTRMVSIEQVTRGVGCGSQVCPIVVSGGVVDVSTRKVTVSISWQEEDGMHQASLSSYLIRWR